jgi:photosystem II stability/assembly factor-like uncharacterized protein
VLNSRGGLSVPAGSNASLSDENDLSPTFVADVAGTYAARLDVTEGGDNPEDTCGEFNHTTVISDAVTIVAVELQANAGSRQDVDVGTQVTLDGGNSIGTIQTYTWARISQTGQSAAPAGGSGQTLTFTLDEPDELEYRLTVDDGTNTADATVVVRSNPPTTTSLTPDTGPVGTRVTIAGTNFSPTSSENAVTFHDAVAAPVITASQSYDQLEVDVPTGAATGPVGVTVLGTGDNVSSPLDFTVTAPDPWTRWASGATDRDLYAVSFVDVTHGWAVGSQGTILNTDGTTWSAQTSGTTQQLRAVSFVDADNGTAVGVNGTLQYTTDGGGTWNGVGIAGHLNVDYWSVSTAGQNAWAAGWISQFGGLGIIVNTNDGWSSWDVDTIPGFSPNDVLFLDADTGWIVGDDASGPAIFWTATGVGNWTAAQTLPDCLPNGVTFVDANRGWAVGTASAGETCVIYSADGGQNWTDQSSGLPALSGGAVDVSFASALVGTMVGARIHRTEDGGVTWSEETRPVDIGFNGVVMLGTTEAVAVGGHQFIGDEAVIIRRQ